MLLLCDLPDRTIHNEKPLKINIEMHWLSPLNLSCNGHERRDSYHELTLNNVWL